MTNRYRHHAVLAMLLASCAAPALAHPGWHDGALAAGLLHPMTGWDHLLAMAAAGLWSARQPQGHRLLPVFLAAMLLGAAAGMAGFAMPGLETGIAATVVACGLLLAAATVWVPAPGTAAPLLPFAAFAVFAALHGNAHGLELPLASAAGYLAGSALLLVAGRRLGAWVSARMLRMAGAGIAVAGVLMLA
ncbi:hypothetical protein GJ700_00155 [Duganella sp. FT92W]|uniref:HupE-UreJ family metal transporter n=1 Tax=Pseudoduganella rivuli TaxID=2666085 RepID=A0A7X2IHZ7_9BURK|nr:HupE/UreJ family protein [Pseudoduganella rivuli]MRV70135.1 hypothetical protein [Pseudoduganella rivuli]